MLLFGPGAFNVRNAGALRACSRLNEVTATTAPAGHHRSDVRPAISGLGYVSVMRASLHPIRRLSRRPRYSGGSQPAYGRWRSAPSSCRFAWQGADPMLSVRTISLFGATGHWPLRTDRPVAAGRLIATRDRRIACGAGAGRGRRQPPPRFGTARDHRSYGGT